MTKLLLSKINTYSHPLVRVKANPNAEAGIYIPLGETGSSRTRGGITRSTAIVIATSKGSKLVGKRYCKYI